MLASMPRSPHRQSPWKPFRVFARHLLGSASAKTAMTLAAMLVALEWALLWLPERMRLLVSELLFLAGAGGVSPWADRAFAWGGTWLAVCCFFLLTVITVAWTYGVALSSSPSSARTRAFAKMAVGPRDLALGGSLAFRATLAGLRALPLPLALTASALMNHARVFSLVPSSGFLPLRTAIDLMISLGWLWCISALIAAVLESSMVTWRRQAAIRATQSGEGPRAGEAYP